MDASILFEVGFVAGAVLGSVFDMFSALAELICSLFARLKFSLGTMLRGGMPVFTTTMDLR